jgi:hypothetical protein
MTDKQLHQASRMRSQDTLLLQEVLGERAPQCLRLLEKPYDAWTESELRDVRELLGIELLATGLDADGNVTHRGDLLEEVTARLPFY